MQSIPYIDIIHIWINMCIIIYIDIHTIHNIRRLFDYEIYNERWQGVILDKIMPSIHDNVIVKFNYYPDNMFLMVI